MWEFEVVVVVFHLFKVLILDGRERTSCLLVRVFALIASADRVFELIRPYIEHFTKKGI
jgi:hypothetical protein